ncbi:MAG: GNAT family N-acetyltransferase [Actinomycetota bacterium]|nr:GNAT family N-acetyltransferase [Actinomycetota bacterium]
MIEVRTARPDDDAALVAIDAATWTPAVSPAPMPEAGTAYFGERTRPEDVLVALVDGIVAGYVQLKQTSSVPSHEHVLLINGLAVHPDHQRSGIGRRLVEAAVEEARRRGVRKLSLRVLGPNTTARRLYETLDFVVEGTLREEFLLDGTYVDDVFMARRL